MENNLQWLEVGEERYPLLFSLNVMEEIQNKFGSMEIWGELLQPSNGTEPKIGVVIDTFYFAINEGIESINFDEKKDESPIERKQVGRIITKLGIKNASKKVRDLVVNSTKDDMPKN